MYLKLECIAIYPFVVLYSWKYLLSAKGIPFQILKGYCFFEKNIITFFKSFFLLINSWDKGNGFRNPDKIKTR